MIPLVEDYLNELLTSRIQYLKNNPQFLTRILGTSKDQIDSLNEFLAKTPVKVIQGWPRTPADVPSICILLANEDESQIGLGDYIDDEEIIIKSDTQDCQVVSGGSEIPYDHTYLPIVPVVEVEKVVNKTTGEIVDPNSYWITNEYLGLLSFSDEVSDKDQLSVTFSFKSSSEVGTEVLYEGNYRIETWTSNGSLTVYLHNIVKWALLSGRDDLGKKGLFRQKLGGADFEPATSWMPEFVYRRALTFWCQYSPSVPVEDIPYIQGVYVDQTVSLDTKEG
jgi:hypothetical protein